MISQIERRLKDPLNLLPPGTLLGTLSSSPSLPGHLAGQEALLLHDEVINMKLRQAHLWAAAASVKVVRACLELMHHSNESTNASDGSTGKTYARCTLKLPGMNSYDYFRLDKRVLILVSKCN